MKTILFPFRNKVEFTAGFTWSFHLANKTRNQLSLFTTVPDDSEQYAASLYKDLIDERDTYIRSVGMGSGQNKPQTVLRNFLKGDFLETFLHFVETYHYDVLVLPSTLLPPRIFNTLIVSHKPVISLAPVDQTLTEQDITSTNETFFVETLHRSACYNLPASFYRSLNPNRSFLERLTAFFTDATKG